jgi:hypothetical protein
LTGKVKVKSRNNGRMEYWKNGETRIRKTGDTRLLPGLTAFGGAIGDQGCGTASKPAEQQHGTIVKTTP